MNATVPVLASTRLHLDALVPADIDRMTEYCQDPVFEQYLTIPWPYTRESARGFVEEYAPDGWRSGVEATWALREAAGGGLLGVIGVRREHGDVGYWLGAPHRGRGLMTGALDLVLDWAFDPASGGLDELTWESVVGNIGSARTARAVGFRYVGTAPNTRPRSSGETPLGWHAEVTSVDRRRVRPDGSRAPSRTGAEDGWPIEVSG